MAMIALQIVCVGCGAGTRGVAITPPVRGSNQGTPSSALHVTVDGIALTIPTAALPPGADPQVSDPGDAIQTVTVSSPRPFREFTVQAVRYGAPAIGEALPGGRAGAGASYRSTLRDIRSSQRAAFAEAPPLELFGQTTPGSLSVIHVDRNGPATRAVAEYVVEAMDRVWIVRSTIDLSGNTRVPTSFVSELRSLSLKGAKAQSAPLPTSAVGRIATANATMTTLRFPEWWKGPCDAGGYVNAYPLQLGSVMGTPACGPLPRQYASTDPYYPDGRPVTFVANSDPVLEWQCVELSKRFLYLAYNIPPYFANGSQIVWNYQGTLLKKVTNDGHSPLPVVGDVLSYGDTTTSGHTAVVSAIGVDSDTGNPTIIVAEENNNIYGQKILKTTNGFVNGKPYAVTGWLHKPAAAVTGYVIPTASSGVRGIAAGSDGALWFAEQTANKIGRMTTNGVVTNEYSLPALSTAPKAIVAGPDGSLWFSEGSSKIGRITTSGSITETVIPTSGAVPDGITSYAGSLWFTETGAGKIGQIATNGVVTKEFTIPTSGSGPRAIVAGPDGALWFTEKNANKIGRMTTAGVFTETAIPTANSSPQGIAVGNDGALWFTEFNANKIGRITTAGVITNEYTIPTANSQPKDIAATAGGGLWFTEQSGNKVARITTDGTITEKGSPPVGTQPTYLTSGPDNAMWYTDPAGNTIGRVVPSSSAVSPTPSPTSTPTPGPTTITEWAIPTANSGPMGITGGPDAALWFTEQNGNKIGRITTSGDMTEFPIPFASSPEGIVPGPDGALWFVNSSGLGRITTAGSLTEYPIPAPSAGGNNFGPTFGITTGPDGAFWLAGVSASGAAFGRMSASGSFSDVALPAAANAYLFDITTSTDGSLWFTGDTSATGNTAEVGRMTSDGTITAFAVPSRLHFSHGIAAGSNSMWFTEYDGGTGFGMIGRATASGISNEYELPTSLGGPLGIAVGTDGALWFAEANSARIGRITTAGLFTEFALPDPSGQPNRITLGPDGALWFTDWTGKIGRVVPGNDVATSNARRLRDALRR
jgi:streptogramin lyase